MKALVVDVETKTTKLESGKRDYTPYCPTNFLVSVGWCVLDLDTGISGPVKYIFIRHKERSGDDTAEWFADVAQCEVIIAHNAKFDVQWLVEAKLLKKHMSIRCTQVREYVMARGVNTSFRLADVAIRYGAPAKLKDLVQEYLDNDVTFDDIPLGIVEEYGRGDVDALVGVYIKQEERLRRDFPLLVPTIEMSCEFIEPLLVMERNGVKIDMVALDLVETEYRAEHEKLINELQDICHKVMGDTPINLSSPEDLSTVLYSRKPKDKHIWRETFNIYVDERKKPVRRPRMSFQTFRELVVANTNTVYRTRAEQCLTCEGTGKTYKTRKDGTLYAKYNICKGCGGAGFLYKSTGEIAGFKLQPHNNHWPSVGGFSTSKEEIDALIIDCRGKGNVNAEHFLKMVRRLSAVETYLSSFVMGIKKRVQYHNNILHVNFNQCVTKTARLSSSDPNLQNQPRANTFPVRRVFISRWAAEGGKIVDTDFAQLEFRAAVHLARCPDGKRDVLAGIDVHIQTRDTITLAGQPIDRQESKPHTFKPLYGGMSGTEAEVTYYKKFLTEYYPTIGEQHKVWHEEAIATKTITLPTGRQYFFPYVERNRWGKATQGTQIVNYPVQGFATGDIVPCAIIGLYREMRRLKLKSKLILTVHDSVSVDAHPTEIETVVKLMSSLAEIAEKELTTRYKIVMFVPLACETKVGDNLLDMKKVA